MARSIRVLQGVVTDLSHDGNGIVKVDDKVYFVPGVLPSETIRFKALKKRRGKFEGVLEEILVPSGDRIDPQCTYFDRCGGCSFLHLEPSVGLKNKEKIFLLLSSFFSVHSLLYLLSSRFFVLLFFLPVQRRVV